MAVDPVVRSVLAETMRDLLSKNPEGFSPGSYLQGIAWISGLFASREPVARAFFHAANSFAVEAAGEAGVTLSRMGGGEWTPDLEERWIAKGAELISAIEEEIREARNPH